MAATEHKSNDSGLPPAKTLRAFPLLAIVGRPNVGKSTLFNRLVGSRRAVVGDEPGITRDRLYGNTEWRGWEFRVVDTGGILPEDKDLIPAEIFRQAGVALAEAAAIVMVVDGRSELAAPDLELVRLLRRTGKPLFLAVNKIDSPRQESLLADFHRLGVDQIFPVSAEHGTGIDDLLDAVLEPLKLPTPVPAESATIAEKAQETGAGTLSEAGDQGTPHGQGPATALPTTHQPSTSEIHVAIIGRPNVGKSTLLNQLTGTARAIVSPLPGTTRDAVDEVVERNGQRFHFVDTAGIRRKGKTHLMAEKLSVVMARKHLEAADIVLLVIDATEGISALDATIAGYAHESGRSVIILVNKWDLWSRTGAAAVMDKSLPLKSPGEGAGKNKMGASALHRTGASAPHKQMPHDQPGYLRRLRQSLKFLSYAPVLFISATTGKNVAKIYPLIEEVARERRKRIPTGEMNRFLKTVDFARASVPMRQRVKILYLTQAAVAPPTFILFTDRSVKLHFAYQRFLENQIRHAFGFVGTPIWIKNRARD
ncbi:MAG TPA: ribosome biogenesis GTPase Der [Terriglobales bacterium]|nr:ribosome biogenesis GTPase Der [Terriglobales bacterium]